MKPTFVNVFVVLGWLACMPAIFSQPVSKNKILFSNPGGLNGFTGGNQMSKIHAATNEFGRAYLRCEMVRAEPDTPTGGCHAEAHLAKFPDGNLFGPFPGFRRTVTYRVKFDTNCDAADVAFFQLKNYAGQGQWNHLIALWRQSGKNGDRILLQSNPFRSSRLLYCSLGRDGVPPLTADSWHEIRVTGHFSITKDSWISVNFDGHEVVWYQNKDCTKKIGTVVYGPLLANIPDSQWQLQLGGYAYFKKTGVPVATDYISDIVVENVE
jgi:hypothetical protein